jgi:hypothetical protein
VLGKYKVQISTKERAVLFEIFDSFLQSLMSVCPVVCKPLDFSNMFYGGKPKNYVVTNLSEVHIVFIRKDKRGIIIHASL